MSAFWRGFRIDDIVALFPSADNKRTLVELRHRNGSGSVNETWAVAIKGLEEEIRYEARAKRDDLESFHMLEVRANALKANIAVLEAKQAVLKAETRAEGDAVQRIAIAVGPVIRKERPYLRSGECDAIVAALAEMGVATL